MSDFDPKKKLILSNPDGSHNINNQMYADWVANLERSGEFPEGAAYIHMIEKLISDNWRNSELALKELLEKEPELEERLGLVLSFLERMATCAWGCRGGSHAIERLVGRSLNSALAALTLAKSGYYDEALGSVRTIGEIANLILLFFNDASSFKTWHSLSIKKRITEFGPARVRKKLENLGQQIPFDQAHYAVLSEISIHVSPESVPQLHNSLDLPMVGGIFQKAGYFAVLHEVSVGVMWITGFVPRMLDLAEERIKTINTSAVNLAVSIEALNILETIDGISKQLKQNAAILKDE